MNQKPIANWEKSDEYPKRKSTSLVRFAWEFLRRNPDYQKDWAEYLSVCRDVIPEYDPHVQLSDDDAAKLESDQAFTRYNPPRLDGENEVSWLERVGSGSELSLPDWYAEKWGLVTFLDPFFDYGKVPFAISFKNSPRVCKVRVLNCPASEHAQKERLKQETLKFDYTLPIQPQIEAAKKYLESAQKRLIKQGVVKACQIKVVREQWVDYLRLLDAEANNKTSAEMAKVIYHSTDNSYPNYGGSKKAAAGLKVAHSWCDTGYSFIPSLKKTPCKN